MVITRRRTAHLLGRATAAVLAMGLVALPAPAAAETATFSNPAPIAVADATFCSPCVQPPGLGNPYPSTIAVSGVAGTISGVRVTLKSVSHQGSSSDLDVLLVGPSGQKLVLVSDGGGATGVMSGATVTFDDAAGALLGADGAWPTGTFRPTDRNDNYGGDQWPAPAPAGPYARPAPTGSATLGSVFGGASPNGAWKLYVTDDADTFTGNIAEGWALELTYAAAAPTTTTLTSSKNPSLAGDAVTFTAHVEKTADGTDATGTTVTFKDGGTTLAAVPVGANGDATLTTSSLTEGTHAITAQHDGDDALAPSSATVTQVVDNPTVVTGDAHCNPGTIVANDAFGLSTPGTASPYPSRVFVSGLSGTVTDLSVTLKDVDEANAQDLDVVLVGPDGQALVVVSDAGGETALADRTVTFDDAALAELAAGSGGWGSAERVRPFDGAAGIDGYPSPAPAAPDSPAPTGNATFASAFAGDDPNGAWKLYVVDDQLGGSGAISGGWCLNVSTVPALPTSTTLTSSPNPSATGGEVTLAAHVETGGGADATAGTVTFRADGIPIGAPVPVSASGDAVVTTSSLTEGIHAVSATYGGGGAAFAPSSDSLSHEVIGPTTVTGNAYCNGGGIDVRDPAAISELGTAAPYPSRIRIGGSPGTIDGLTVRLEGVTHTAPDDVDVLLVGPDGTSLELVSDSGGTHAVSDVDLRVSDGAAAALPDEDAWGTGAVALRPADHGTGADAYPAPAPNGAHAAPAPSGSATLAGTFGGKDAAGTWSLYVTDDTLGDSGSLSGWCIELVSPVEAKDDEYDGVHGAGLTVAAPGVLSNDTGVPAPSTTPIANGATTEGGTVTLGADGRFTYTPRAGFSGTDTFTYTAGNGDTTDTATVSIDVPPDPPVVATYRVSLRAGGDPVTGQIATVVDSDTPSQSLLVTTGTLPDGITMTSMVHSQASVFATLSAACDASTGDASIPLSVRDGDGDVTDETVPVHVAANEAPVLTYGPAAVNAGGTVDAAPASGPSDDSSLASLEVHDVPDAFEGTVTVEAPGSGQPGRVAVRDAGPAGDYAVEVRATDNCGVTRDATLNLSVNGAPSVDAGPDATVALGTGTDLAGTVTDDGRAPGGATSSEWTQVSGPGTARFGDAGAPATTATFDEPGRYVLRLAAGDGELSASDTVAITVSDKPPVVEAATPQPAADDRPKPRADDPPKPGADDPPKPPAAPSPAPARDIVVLGTPRPDRIRIEPSDARGRIDVWVDGRLRRYRDTATRILVSGRGGDDRIDVDPRLALPAVLLGGSGLDRVSAGGGRSIVHGGTGNDRLSGGRQGDAILGGAGIDRLSGGPGDDMLLGGMRRPSGAPRGWLATLATAWHSRPGYDERIAAVRALLPHDGPLVDDLRVDLVDGGPGSDWYVLSATPRARDRAAGRGEGERTAELAAIAG